MTEYRMTSLTDYMRALEGVGETRDYESLAFAADAAGIRNRAARIARLERRITAILERFVDNLEPSAERGRTLDGEPEDRDDWWQQWLATQAASSLSSEGAGDSSQRPRSIPDVELRSEAAPRVLVQLSRAARRDLDHEAYASRPRTISAPLNMYERGLYEDGVESGGYLFGRFTRDALADVELIIGAGAAAVSTPTSITFQSGDLPATDFERELRDVHDNRQTRLIGDWHVHPNCVGDPGESRPSAGDLRAWGRLLERVEEERSASRVVCLIGLSKGGDAGLFRVDWHGWVVQRTSAGSFICEPASMADR